jgi:hypothetical protein
MGMTALTHVSYSVSVRCYNGWESYGEICVHCGCCGKPGTERDRARLAMYRRRLEEQVNFDQWFTDSPEWLAVQKRNQKANITRANRHIRYYEGK